MPDLSGGIVHVEALTAVAAIRGVALVQNATTVLAGDEVNAGELAIRRAHIPLPEPEIELTMIARITCACGGSGGRGEGSD